MLESILTSDPNDPASYVNTKGGEYNAAYKTLRAAFNFQTDGTLAAGDKPQTAAQIKTTSDNYMVRYNDADEAADATLINSFKSLMKIVSNVDDLIADTKIMKLALTAVGLENESDTARKIRRVLTSDLTDPKSYVYTLKDDRYLQLAKAFNFNADGSRRRADAGAGRIRNPQHRQVLCHRKEPFRDRGRQDQGDGGSEILQRRDFEGQIPRRAPVQTGAWSISCLFPPGWIRKKCRPTTSARCFSPISAIRTASSTRSRITTIYKELVASYNFDSKGELARPELGIQTKRGLLETEDLYLNQTLEQQRGEGQCRRAACTLFPASGKRPSTPLTIFWPTAPFCRVIQTTFSIPEAMSSADVDVQYAYINRLLDVKDLQDPDKLEKLLLRFTALYDVENNVDISAAQLILSGGGGGGISADTLFSLSQLRLGGF